MIPPTLASPATWALTQERVLVWMLVLTRMSGFLGAFPGLGEGRLPARVRLVLGVLLAAVVAPLVPRPRAPIEGLPALILAMALELAAGVLLGTLVSWVMEAVLFAGQFMDTQIGFSFVQLVDPLTAQPSSLASQVLGRLTLLLLFTTGLHHLMIQAFADSYRLVPVGEAPAFQLMALLHLFGQFMAKGIMLAFPVLAVLFLVDLILGISGKFMPQLQLLQLGFPLKIAVGLMVLGLVMRGLGGWIHPLLEAAVRRIPSVMHG